MFPHITLLGEVLIVEEQVAHLAQINPQRFMRLNQRMVQPGGGGGSGGASMVGQRAAVGGTRGGVGRLGSPSGEPEQSLGGSVSWPSGTPHTATVARGGPERGGSESAGGGGGGARETFALSERLADSLDLLLVRALHPPSYCHLTVNMIAS